MMDMQELLPLYALGVLAPEEAAAVERALAADPKLRRELAGYRSTTDELLGALPRVAPSADVRARLFTSVGAGRFERFSSAIAKIYDVTVERAREILGLLYQPEQWELTNPLAKLVHFSGGPACAGADTGLVIIAPGGTFPYHCHHGEELTLVLAGTAVDSRGVVMREGETYLEPPGVAHDITNHGTEDFVYAARVVGLDFDVKKPE